MDFSTLSIQSLGVKRRTAKPKPFWSKRSSNLDKPHRGAHKQSPNDHCHCFGLQLDGDPQYFLMYRAGDSGRLMVDENRIVYGDWGTRTSDTVDYITRSRLIEWMKEGLGLDVIFT